MKKATTIAQGIADRFGNDGQRWHAHGAALVATIQHEGGNLRGSVFVFADGSGIGCNGGAWDVVTLDGDVWRSVEQDGTLNPNGWTFPRA